VTEVFYYWIVATAASFIWLILSGHRPRGERRLLGALFFALEIASTVFIFALWRRLVLLSVGLGLINAILVGLLWLLWPDWNTRGHAFMVAFTAVQIIFIARIAWAILTGGLGVGAILLSLILFAAELTVVFLTIYFAFEVLNVVCRIRWRRRYLPFTGSSDYWPKVSIHVPAHSEPPEMVIKTLTALQNLDYPTYEVIMVDDNTDEDELWHPVVEFCHRNGIKVFHLRNYPGFKSGALNFALSQTAPDVEVIAVVDSDYLVSPNFLRETVPYFLDPRVAFVQTPQAFYNHEDNLFAHYSDLSQRFFFEISMCSRNEQNAIIFCGTMGLIRKRVLERIAGWDERCITEDAEASLRILQKGYESIYINQPYGHGILPVTFEATKKQRFRWAFGGMQILRRYWRQLLPIPSIGRTDGLGFGQRIGYLMGLLGWFNDLLVLIFSAFLLVTALAFTYGWNLPVRHLTQWILLVPLLSIITGVLRVAWALRISTGASWRSGLGTFRTMLALSLTVARACISALWNDKGTFLRTPKFTVESDITRALGAASWEALIGILLAAAIPLVLNARSDAEGWLLAALLGWHALVYLSALRSALIETLPVKADKTGSESWTQPGAEKRESLSI
jgi:cellulose synthase/poly-beta-1,6-N-acetylglucosamine synthase-like glycosyltransferase